MTGAMKERFVYEPGPSRIVFGPGRIDEIAGEAERLGIGRVAIVTTPGRRAAAERAATALGGACAGVSATAEINIPRTAFDAAMADLRAFEADGFVAIGGGSPIGLGKALTLKTGLPHIAVPTTYSGSEMRPDWRIEDADGVEGATGDDRVLPATIVFDAELTLDLPPSISGPSGMNAAAHAVESLYHPAANPVSTAMAVEGLRLLAEALPKVVDAPGDLAARITAFAGTWLAGGFRAGSCLEHRIAQRLRTLCGLSHAQTHAIVLPFVAAFNEDAAPEAMALIAGALGAGRAPGGLFALNDRLGIPANLAAIGVREADLDHAADVITSVEIANPRTVTRDDVRALIDDAYSGRRPPV